MFTLIDAMVTIASSAGFKTMTKPLCWLLSSNSSHFYLYWRGGIHCCFNVYV